MSSDSDISTSTPPTAPTVPAQRRPVAAAAATRAEQVRWQRRLRAAVVLTDLLVVAVTTTLFIAVGLTAFAAADRARIVCGLIAAALLLVALPLARAWDGRALGTGSTEFLRLARAVALADIVLAFGGLSLMVTSVRVWVFLFVPVTGLLLVVSRFAVRKTLHRRRRQGAAMLSVLAVGSPESVADMVARTVRDRHFGWRIDGVCTPTGRGTDGSAFVAGVPVIGDLDSIGPLLHTQGFRVVSVGQAPGWGPRRLHQLAWDLEGTDVELAVDPGLMEIAGPRMHITPVDGLPLLRLSQPRFTGASRAMKLAFDRFLAALLLVLVAPVFLAIAVAVKLDGGPVFFRQERVGTNGRPFRMVKFRSMVVDAEARLAALQQTNEAAGPLFKMASDPRVTRVGAVLRRYSLDELPQLLNVLAGTMSLVGPRPPLAAEVETYEDVARRRLLVRPGMTGLWQISGRSDLSWEESVRLDLRYVENWSLALDLTILWKTFGAVVGSRGAY